MNRNLSDFLLSNKDVLKPQQSEGIVPANFRKVQRGGIDEPYHYNSTHALDDP
jgi:hypothetical protein